VSRPSFRELEKNFSGSPALKSRDPGLILSCPSGLDLVFPRISYCTSPLTFAIEKMENKIFEGEF
jgi:hypothetical protein